jgi:hypothetical protein
MRTRTIPIQDAGLLAILTLCAGTADAAFPPATPPVEEVVILTGWLHVEDLTMKDVVLEVEVNGTTRTTPVSESGRFTVELPADAEATLRFEKPHHVPKEVKVDTRHAGDGGTGPRTRRVRFAVIMELERLMGGLTYAGPVGSIGFDQGGGCVAVQHTRQLVPAKRRATMEF